MRQIMGFFVGIFIGWLVGATIALLLAPQTGESLRGEINSRSTGFVDEIKSAVDSRRTQLERQLEAMRAPRVVG
jgi:gas vesicle protein